MKRVWWKVKANNSKEKAKLAKLHRELFGHKVKAPESAGRNGGDVIEVDGQKFYRYKGILGHYTEDGEWVRKAGVERVRNGEYLIDEELIDDVKLKLEECGISNYGIVPSSVFPKERADWRRRR